MNDTAVARTIEIYQRMSAGGAQVSENARERLSAYIRMLVDGGQGDPDRLTVFGLSYLRELDGKNDPVRAGYTGM
ncbi:MAG: hypothetical protein ACXWJW_15045 [Xanthobacteraceae bacterium]